MKLIAPQLAKTVVQWLEFERLCGRVLLLDESYMASAIMQYMSAAGHTVDLEYPHPTLKGQNKVDFAALTPRAPKGLIHPIETKFVNGKRSAVQEIVDDLFRLEAIQVIEPAGGRWLLIAGQRRHLDGENAFGAVGKRGGRKLVALRGILRMTGVGQSWTVKVDGSSLPQLTYFKNAPVVKNAAGTREWPKTFVVRLVARYPDSAKPRDFQCFVWKVSRSTNRSTCTL